MGVSLMRIVCLTLLTECVYGNISGINNKVISSNTNSNNVTSENHGMAGRLHSNLTLASSSIDADNRTSSKINEITTPRRMVGGGTDRDNKLMSVLQARRTALTRVRWRKDFSPMKLNKQAANENLVEDSSTPESNSIISSNKHIDEIFDTDETVHGMYVVNPRTGKIAVQQTAPQIKLAKETNNFISNQNINKTETTKLTPTKSSSSTRTYFDSRTKRTRDRKTLPISTEKSIEETDAGTFPYYGQKISTSTKNSDIRNQVISTKRVTHHNKVKDESLEIMEVSVPKPSTEKSKLWNNRIQYHNRNIVAFNNYLRRQTSVHKVEPVVTTTVASVIRYENTLVESKPKLDSSPMVSLNNLAEGIVDSKVVYSRSANSSLLDLSDTQKDVPQAKNQETPEKQDEPPKTHDIISFFGSSAGLPGISKLIINIPDDATPEDIFQPTLNNAGTEVPEISTSLQINESSTPIEEVIETTQQNREDYETPRNLVSIPDINHIFQNLSTTESSQIPEIIPTTETIIIILPNLNSSSTSSRTTISTTVLSTTLADIVTEDVTSASTTLPVTEIPVQQNKTKVPLVSNRILVEEENVPEMNQTDSGFNPILSKVFPNLTETKTVKTPVLIDMAVINTSPPPTVMPTKKTTEMFDGVILQHNSDVVIEMRKMNTATFVLAGLGMLPILIIVLYVLKAVVFKKENKVTRDLERYIPDGQPPISPVVRLEQSDSSSASDESIMTDHDFNRKDLRFKSLLGEGNFGQVWKAEADDLAGHLGTTRIVAVKTERSDNGHGDLKAEAEIMKKLGSHPNVVTLLGACLEQEPHLLIMEYAMRGRLLSLLRAARGAVNGLAPSVHNNRPPIMPLSPRRLTGFAHDIARGMEYISEKKIVHRDLAARNVLLDHNGICKICDFGMSVDLEKAKASQSQIRIPRVQQSESRFRFDLTVRAFGVGKHGNHGNDTKSRPALPIRWMAPEALQYHIFSRETDIWAFGIVLWEIATLGCTPYPNLSGREVVRNVPNGARPEIPTDCRPELYDLMQRTWRKDPRQRPSFSDSRITLARTLCQWQAEENDNTNTSEYLDVSGFSEDLEQGMVYFNRRISEFECEI